MNPKAKELFDSIADHLISEIENAKPGQWVAPWVRSAANGGPVSIDGRPYRGGNALWLSLLVAKYPSQTFGTFKAWKRHGASVTKGSKGIPVALWKFGKVKEKDDAGNEREKAYCWCKVYFVFAAEQTDIDLDTVSANRRAKLPDVAERIARADHIVAGWIENETSITHHGSSAFYMPGMDSITMPPREAFKSTEGYYGTLFHEMGHATGHESRLERDMKGRFGSHEYAVEELVAEFCAAFVCCATAVTAEPRADHAKYLASWAAALKEHRGALILTASSQAQKAADFILQYDVSAEAADEEEMAEAA